MTNHHDIIDPLHSQFEILKKLISEKDYHNSSISKWSVYMQLEHILLANTGICEMIEKGEVPSDKKSRSILSYLTFIFGYIPRGRAESPTYVIPKNISQEGLVSMLNNYETCLQKLKSNAKLKSQEVVGNHPYFGGLNRLEWIRFIEIHTKHHLKIIDDIKNVTT